MIDGGDGIWGARDTNTNEYMRLSFDQNMSWL
jgi:hypothetical protein